MTRGQGPLGRCTFAEPRSAWTLRLRSGQARKGARPHTSRVQSYLAVLQRDVFLWVDRAHVISAWANQAVVVELFDDMRGPAANPRDREDGCEQIHIDTKGVVGGSRIEVHIGIEFLARSHEFFDLLRVFEPSGIAAGMAQVAGHLAQVRGPRIFGVIN